MKKILLASTALVATTGFAAAEMTWSGSANVGMKYSDSGTTTIHEEIDLGMSATGETDGGIGWAVEMGLDSNVSDSAETQAADGGSVSLSGDFGTIKVGNVSTAGTSIGLPDVGFDTIGIDDAAELGRNAATASASMDVRWTYSMDDIALDVSTDTSNDDMAASVKWSSGSLAIGISHAAAGATGGATANAMSIGTSVGGFAVNVMAATNSASAKDSVGMSASMPMDGLGTVTFVTGSNDTDAKASWGLGFSKALGGGATLAGAFGSANDNNKADLGINLSF
jgi:outer membrane protein OmpU